MDITHLHLHVRDRARSAAFYTRWLGMKHAFGTDDITFMTGDRDFLLALAHDPSAAPLPAWFHFGARLQSAAHVRELLLAMEAAGVPIVKPLYAGPTVTSFRCSDPDGYPIEIYAEPE